MIRIRHLVPLLVAITLALFGAGTARAQPGFSKSFTPSTIAVGSASQLVFFITNAEMVTPAGDLAFTDTLPAGVTIADPASASTTCGGSVTAPAGGSTITLAGGSLAADEECEVRVDVTSSVVGTHMNVSGDLTSTAGNSGNATADLTVSSTRIQFSKSFSPATVRLGGRSTLTFDLVNPNAAVVGNVAFSDTLPEGLVFAEPANVSSTCTGTLQTNAATGTISLLGGFLTASASCTIQLDVIADAGGLQVNRSGVLNSTQGTSGFAVAGLQVDVSPLALSKSFTDDPVPPGDTVTLRFSITNFDRDSFATGITFDDDLDATLSGLVATGLPAAGVCGPGSTLSGTAQITLAGGELAPGETCTFDVVLQVPVGATSGAYPNTTSSITGDVGGDVVVGAPASETLFVSPVPSLSKTILDDPAVAGSTIDIEFTLTNSSPSAAATNLGFTDNLTEFLPTLTSAADIVALPAPGFCGAGSSAAPFSPGAGQVAFQISGAQLAASDSCTFQVTLNVPATTPTNEYVNTTSVVSGMVGGEAVEGNPASDTLSVVAAPRLLKAFGQVAVQAGQNVLLEFTLESSDNAPAPATGIGFTDDLNAAIPGMMTVSLPADGFCGPGSTISGGATVTVSGASLDPNSTCTFSVTVQVPAGTVPDTYTNTTSEVTATVDGLAVTSPPAANDLTVVALTLGKTFVGSPVVAGGSLDLEFTIENLSTDTAASSISFTDDLGDVLTGLTATGLPQADVCGAGSNLSLSGDTLVLSGGNLAAASSCTFSVTLQVPVDAAAGQYTNSTTPLVADFGGSVVQSPPAMASFDVIDALDFGKEFTDDPVAPGGTVTLEFTLTNASPTDAATGLAFTDDLDAVVSGAVAVGLPMADVCGAGSQVSGSSLITLTGGNLAPGTSCTFPVTIQIPAGASASTAINTTSQLSGQVGGVAAMAPPATDDLRIDQLALEKTFADPVGAGTTVVLTFQIENLGSDPVEGISFTDDLDATLAGLVASGLPAADVCGEGSMLSGTSLLTFSGGSLAGGASCSFDVTLQVPAGAAPGSYLNTTSNLQVQGVPFGTPATDTLDIEPPPAFGKVFAPDTLGVGEVTTLTFTIDNSGSSVAATGLAFLDTFPAGLVVADPANASTTCTGGTLMAAAGAGSVSYSGGSVAAGASCIVEVDVTSDAASTYLNVSSELTSSLGTSGTASDSVGFVLQALVLEKEFLGTAVAGGTVDLRFTLTNNGSGAATGIAFSDDLDAVMPGLVAVGLPQMDVCGAGSEIAGTSVLTFTGGSVAAGSFCTFTVTLQLPATLGPAPYVNVTSEVTFDRGGVALVAAPAEAELAASILAIPTLSFWGLLLLAALVGAVGLRRLR